MALATIKGNHITLNKNRYFAANAWAVTIGSYGKKATPLLGANKLEVKDRLPGPKLDGIVRTQPPIELDESHSSKTDFNQMVSGSLAVIGLKVSHSEVYESLSNNKLKLVELIVDEEDMRRTLNQSPKILDTLAGYGNDARVAHRCLMAVEAEMAKSFTSGTKFDVSVDAAGIVSVKSSGGSTVSGGTTLKLGPNTCIGYLLLKLNWNNGKTQIESTSCDEQSLN